MDLSVDQMVDFLTDAFQEIDKETLFLVLQANGYSLDRALETLMAMESDGKNPPPARNPPSQSTKLPSSSTTLSSSSSSNQKIKRGSAVRLPDDFLRPSDWIQKQQEYNQTGSLVNLMADPIFLQELEREFGPNYQAVLREHLQAEALRNTADRAPYSDQISPPRQFYVQSNPNPYSGAPYSHQYFNTTPAPYSHSALTVGQQQPPVLTHQIRPTTLATSPSQSSSSNLWFSSPFSSSSSPPQSTTTASPGAPSPSQNREHMVGISGEIEPVSRDEGPSSKSTL